MNFRQNCLCLKYVLRKDADEFCSVLNHHLNRNLECDQSLPLVSQKTEAEMPEDWYSKFESAIFKDHWSWLAFKISEQEEK